MPNSKSLMEKLLQQYTVRELSKQLGVSARTIYYIAKGSTANAAVLEKMDMLSRLAAANNSSGPANQSVSPNELAELRAAIQRIESSLKRQETSLLIVESYVKVLAQTAMKHRAALEDLPLGDLQAELHRALAESLRQIQAAHSPST